VANKLKNSVQTVSKWLVAENIRVRNILWRWIERERTECKSWNVACGKHHQWQSECRSWMDSCYKQECIILTEACRKVFVEDEYMSVESRMYNMMQAFRRNIMAQYSLFKRENRSLIYKKVCRNLLKSSRKQVQETNTGLSQRECIGLKQAWHKQNAEAEFRPAANKRRSWI